MSRRRTGARTIAVINGKGGSSKTPTTAMLAAAFARDDGGGVLAWDNNETRGTLGWLTERDPHEGNVRDLLADIRRPTKGAAATADVAGYVHHQSVDGYDVLPSDPSILGDGPRLSAEDFDAVHTLVGGRYRIIVIDSGSDVDAPTWVRMLERVDQVVVATTTRREHAESARLLLSALHSRDARSAALADEATVIVSHADRQDRPPAEVAPQFEWLARATVAIPYDEAMRSDALRFDRLAPATQEAWVRAAETVAAAGRAAGVPDASPNAAEPQVRPTPGSAGEEAPSPAPAPSSPSPPAATVEPETPVTPLPPVTATTPPPAGQPSPPPGLQTPPPPQGAEPAPPGGTVTSYLRTHQPAATENPSGPAQAPTSPSPQEEKASATTWWGDPRRRLTVVGVALGLVILLVLAFLAGGALMGEDGPTPAPVGQAPVEPVDGWVRDGAWRSPTLAEDARVLVADETVVTTVDGEGGRRLTALRGEDGAGLWSTALEDPLTGPPQLVTTEDGEAVIAATEHTLIMWPDVGSGKVPEPRTWDFTEAEVEPVPGAARPLLANEETLTALVLHEDRLEKRTLPSGYRPLTVDERGRILTVSDDGHWRSVGTDGRTSDPALLQPPSWGSLVHDVLGMTGDTLVVSWARDDGGGYVVGYDTQRGMRPRWEVKVADRPTAEDFDVAPDGSWMIAGRTAIEARSGRDHRLPGDWETVGITVDRAWSSSHVSTRTGRVSDLEGPGPDAEQVPVAVTDDGVGLLVADGERSRLYGVRPDTEA